MSIEAAVIIWLVAALYALIGAAIAAWLLAGAIARIDPLAAAAPLRVKLLIAPGLVALWPLMLMQRAAAKPGGRAT